MGRLLHELLRWRRTAPATAIGGRWSAWARALAARHARLDARAGAPAMTLAAARAGGSRWTRSLLALQPRIELAIRFAVAGSPGRSSRARPGGAPPAPAAARRAAPPGGARPSPVAGGPARVLAAATVRPVPAPAPARIARVAASRAAPRHRRAELAVDACRLTVRHIVERRRRVEEPRGLPVAERRPAGVAPATGAGAPSADRVDGWVARRPAMLVTAPRGAAARDVAPGPTAPDRAPDRPAHEPAAAPALDLESLTDHVVRQIDRRIVAHRERMGRI